VGIFIKLPTNKEYLIEEAQFFKYATVKDPETDFDVMVLPGEAPSAETKTLYYYYDPKSEYTSIDDIFYVATGYEPNSNYTEVM
jgi:hypothetical protein